MSSDTLVAKVLALLEKAADAYEKDHPNSDVHEPEWPKWYASFLREELAALLHADFTESELIYFLVLADRKQSLEAPGAHWPKYFARLFVERYS